MTLSIVSGNIQQLATVADATPGAEFILLDGSTTICPAQNFTGSTLAIGLRVVALQVGKQIYIVGNSLIGGGVAPGTIGMFGGTTAPYGTLAASGQSLLVATYPALFAAIHYSNGGSGLSFNVPNLNNANVPVGSLAPGNTGGSTSHVHAEAIHSHALSDNGQAAVYYGVAATFNRRVTSPSWTPTHTEPTNGAAAATTPAQTLGSALRGTTDNSTAVNTGSASNLQPYVGVLFTIKT